MVWWHAFKQQITAGHTLEFDHQKFVLRSIPSGIFQGNTINIIGNGVVLDPVLFREEAEGLATSGVDIKHKPLLSKKTHLILPTHRVCSMLPPRPAREENRHHRCKGIFTTYTDKVGRNGIRRRYLVTPL